jgi:hypothetical protein
VKRFVRWAGAIFGLAAFAVLVVIAWGTGLPLYHVATCTATIGERPALVYDAVESDGQSPAWRSDIVRVMEGRDPSGRPVWVEVGTHGESTQYDETSASRAAGEIVRTIDEPSAPYAGTWTYWIRPDGALGSAVTIREDGTIFNPVFRFAARYFFGYTTTMQTYIEDLGHKFRETPSVECSATTSATPP